MQSDTSVLIQHADQLKHSSDILAYYSRFSYAYSRLSQTIIRCLHSIIPLSKRTQTDAQFARWMKFAFIHAHDKRSGSYEFNICDDGTVWISGSFHIDVLRDRMLVVSSKETLIEMERDDG